MLLCSVFSTWHAVTMAPPRPFVPSTGIRPPMHAGQAPVLRGAASLVNGVGRVRGVLGVRRRAKATLLQCGWYAAPCQSHAAAKPSSCCGEKRQPRPVRTWDTGRLHSTGARNCGRLRLRHVPVTTQSTAPALTDCMSMHQHMLCISPSSAPKRPPCRPPAPVMPSL